MPKLRLDAEGHYFRSSLFRHGKVLILLDKAASEPAGQALLMRTVDGICEREGIRRRIGVPFRSPAVPPEINRGACALLHERFDEIVAWESEDTYRASTALPGLEPGWVGALLREEFDRLNAAAPKRKRKPVTILSGWEAVEAHLRERLARVKEPTLVVINHAPTGAVDRIRKMVDFAKNWAPEKVDA
jgi:hypothetical protein